MYVRACFYVFVCVFIINASGEKFRYSHNLKYKERMDTPNESQPQRLQFRALFRTISTMWLRFVHLRANNAVFCVVIRENYKRNHDTIFWRYNDALLYLFFSIRLSWLCPLVERVKDFKILKSSCLSSSSRFEPISTCSRILFCLFAFSAYIRSTIHWTRPHFRHVANNCYSQNVRLLFSIHEYFQNRKGHWIIGQLRLISYLFIFKRIREYILRNTYSLPI